MKFSASATTIVSVASWLSLASRTSAQDSITLQLVEDLDNVDLSVLGTAGLEKYNAAWDLTVDDDCNYEFTLQFDHANGNPTGPDSYQGQCSPNVNGQASDGKRYHDKRTNWLQLPEFVERSTSFNHMDMSWVPCGKQPLGFRQSRYDINFYLVSPQYRTLMTCDTFETPAKCQYDQSSSRGRQHFVVPVQHGNAQIIANVPTGFQPDPNEPNAFEHEGIILGLQKPLNPNIENDVGIPQIAADWERPTFEMSAFDGDIISWRAIIPFTFLNGGSAADRGFSAEQDYNFKTERRLPDTYRVDFTEGVSTVRLTGPSGLCGANFDAAKQEWLDEQAQGGGRSLRN